MLQRLTTEYIETEDRIRLSGEDAAGRVHVLWLSQRLLNRLVPALCDTLARTGDAAALLQSFEQEAARAGHQPQPPVSAHDPGWLVLAVDVARAGNGLHLRFRGAGDEQVAQVGMAETALRQWLSILLEQYRRGEWPAAAWPVWMDPAAAPPPAAVMH